MKKSPKKISKNVAKKNRRRTGQKIWAIRLTDKEACVLMRIGAHLQVMRETYLENSDRDD